MIVPIYNNSNNKNPEYTCPTDAGCDLRADFSRVSPDNPLPTDAGCDLRADFSRVSPDNPLKIYGDGGIIFAGEGHPLTMLRLEPMARTVIPTGIFGAIPEGYEVQVRPRSGMAIKKGLVIEMNGEFL